MCMKKDDITTLPFVFIDFSGPFDQFGE